MKNVSRGFLLTLVIMSCDIIFSILPVINCQILSVRDGKGKSLDSIFNCISTGNFEDVRNRRSYWYCDVSSDGSFVAIRRTCPYGQVYNAQKRSCIYSNPPKNQTSGKCNEKCVELDSCDNRREETNVNKTYIIIINEDNSKQTPCQETTCDTSSESEADLETDTTDSELSSLCATKFGSKTPCQNSVRDIGFECTSEGAFADPNNKNNFYICHRKLNFPDQYEGYKIRCPSGLLFNENLGKCARQSRETSENLKTFENLLRLLKFMSDDIHRNEERDTASTKRFVENEDGLGQKFLCRREGRFPDPTNRDHYYLCYPKNTGRGYLTLNLKCPEYSLFDANNLACSKEKYLKLRRQIE